MVFSVQQLEKHQLYFVFFVVLYIILHDFFYKTKLAVDVIWVSVVLCNHSNFNHKIYRYLESFYWELPISDQHVMNYQFSVRWNLWTTWFTAQRREWTIVSFRTWSKKVVVFLSGIIRLIQTSNLTMFIDNYAS